MTGDTVFSFPVIKSLRATYPDAQIDVLVSPRGSEVINLVGPELGVTNCFTYNFYHPKLGAWWLRRRLKGRLYDAVFMLDTNTAYYQLVNSAVVGRGWYRMVAQYDALAGTQVKQNELPLHIADQYLRLVEAATIRPVRSYAFTLPERSKKYRDKFRNRFLSATKLVGIHWGNHSKNTNILFPKETFDGRSWQMSKLLEMATTVYAHNPDVVFVLTGGPYEARMVKRLYKQLLRNGIPVVNMAGKTNHLTRFLGVLASFDVFVVGDTGPMHLASAIKQKTVMLTLSTNPNETGPYQSTSTVPIGASLACMPCLNQTHEHQCPPLNCSDALHVQSVVSQVLEFLN